MSLTDNEISVCEAVKMDYKGNAAGNTEYLFDLTGENKQVAWYPAGFTAKGIVAMVFSCVSAFLGMAFITVYDLSGIQSTKTQNIQQSAEIESSE